MQSRKNKPEKNQPTGKTCDFHKIITCKTALFTLTILKLLVLFPLYYEEFARLKNCSKNITEGSTVFFLKTRVVLDSNIKKDIDNKSSTYIFNKRSEGYEHCTRPSYGITSPPWFKLSKKDPYYS